jgi:hypothetical protein
MKMLTVKFMGRLGNQMFEYAFAKAQAKRLGVELALDVSLYREDHPFQLLQWQGVTERIVPKQKTTFREEGMPYNPELVSKIKDGDVISGYWQTPKYFNEIKDELRQIFVPKWPISKRAFDWSNRILDAGTGSVAVHIRRGDYLSEQHSAFHGVLPFSYYQEAAKLMPKMNEMFIFSEDLTDPFVQSFEGYKNIHIVPPGEVNKEEAEDIWLQTLCQQHIVANSTFSFWGAWLADSPNQVVVAPKQWFQSTEVDYRDLLPEAWIKI